MTYFLGEEVPDIEPTFEDLCKEPVEYEISIRRGRVQNTIETELNTCANYKEVFSDEKLLL